MIPNIYYFEVGSFKKPRKREISEEEKKLRKISRNLQRRLNRKWFGKEKF